MTLNPAAMRGKLASVPVVKSGLSLMSGTVVTSALGLVFWILAANLYDTSEFGVSTTAVYTMMMLADVACLGLRTGLVRYVPRAGPRTARTIAWGYGLVLAASTLTATLFLAGLRLWAPDLIELRDSVLVFIFFVAATAFWALFMLEDAVLVGLRRATWVPLENSLFGVLKIVLLFPFATLSPTLGIFWAWTLPVFPIVIGINLFIARLVRSTVHSGAGIGQDSEDTLRGAGEAIAPTRSLVRDIMSFSIADWFAAVARLVALAVIPLMVLAQRDQAEAGYFQAAWLIAFTIFALSSNAAYAMLAETSYEQTKIHKNSLEAGVLSLALTLPIILVGVVGAPLLLRIYGADYAQNSSAVLRILLVAAVPNVLHQIFIGRLRSQGRMVAVVLLETALSVLVVTLAWLFLPRYGINGIGLAWLVGLGVLAAYAAANETLWWWAGRLDTRVVRRVGAALGRLRLGRPARGMDSRLDEALAAVNATNHRASEPTSAPTLAPKFDGAEPAIGPATYKVLWLDRGDDSRTAVLAVEAHRELVVEFARSPAGARELEQRRRIIAQLAHDAGLAGIPRLLPEIRGDDQTPGHEFLAYTRPTGPTALDLVRAGTPIELVTALALETIGSLHRATAAPTVVDAEIIDSWIEEPVARLVTAGRASATNVEQLRRVLREGFSGRIVDVGRIHGELALDNIVMAADGPAVVGLLGWHNSTVMPLVVDRATLALSDLAMRGDEELGTVVRSLLADPTPFDEHPAMVGGADPSPTSTAVLILAWLHLVGRPLPPRRTMSSEVFWLARNARPVLVSLESLIGSRR